MIAAAGHDSAIRQDLFDFLAERYWKPAFIYLRSRGFSVEAAEDLVQQFFLKCMDGVLFERANATRGRFRDLLFTALRNFAANSHRREHAKCRVPEGGLVSIHDLSTHAGLASVPNDRPDVLFERTWMGTLLLRVLDQLKRECQQTGKQSHFQIFHRRIIAPILEGAIPPSLAVLGAELGLSEKKVGNQLVTARRAYQRLLRDEIALYAASEAEVEDEIGRFFAIFADSR